MTIIKQHPKMLRMRAIRYVDLYQNQNFRAKQWYAQYVPEDERIATNEIIRDEFTKRGMK